MSSSSSSRHPGYYYRGRVYTSHDGVGLLLLDPPPPPPPREERGRGDRRLGCSGSQNLFTQLYFGLREPRRRASPSILLLRASTCRGLRECEHLTGCSGPGLGPEFDEVHLTGFDGGPRQASQFDIPPPSDFVLETCMRDCAPRSFSWRGRRSTAFSAPLQEHSSMPCAPVGRAL